MKVRLDDFKKNKKEEKKDERVVNFKVLKAIIEHRSYL